MKDHIFFDMDGTLTRSRSTIKADMAEALDDLRRKGTAIVIVSGAGAKQIAHQIPSGVSYILAQNGNHAIDDRNKEIWRNGLNWIQKLFVFTWIMSVAGKVDAETTNAQDLVEDRGCQISYSLTGHHHPLPLKESFDPNGLKRAKLLVEYPFTSDDMDVCIGGTTCLDFFKKGMNKGNNIKEFIQRMKWDKERCLYIGDALYKGGNDWSVEGIIDTQQVTGPEQTLEIIRAL